jgi:hypothetical protein
MARMEITVVLAFIIVSYLIMLLTGGFNDLIEHRKKVNQSRKEWKRINKHRQ